MRRGFFKVFIVVLISIFACGFMFTGCGIFERFDDDQENSKAPEKTQLTASEIVEEAISKTTNLLVKANNGSENYDIIPTNQISQVSVSGTDGMNQTQIKQNKFSAIGRIYSNTITYFGQVEFLLKNGKTEYGYETNFEMNKTYHDPNSNLWVILHEEEDGTLVYQYTFGLERLVTQTIVFDLTEDKTELNSVKIFTVNYLTNIEVQTLVFFYDQEKFYESFLSVDKTDIAKADLRERVEAGTLNFEYLYPKVNSSSYIYEINDKTGSFIAYSLASGNLEEGPVNDAKTLYDSYYDIVKNQYQLEKTFDSENKVEASFVQGAYIASQYKVFTVFNIETCEFYPFYFEYEDWQSILEKLSEQLQVDYSEQDIECGEETYNNAKTLINWCSECLAAKTEHTWCGRISDNELGGYFIYSFKLAQDDQQNDYVQSTIRYNGISVTFELKTDMLCKITDIANS